MPAPMPALDTTAVARKTDRPASSFVRPVSPQAGLSRNWIDLLVAALTMAAFVLWIHHFRYDGLLGEDDLYRALVGLLDGAPQHTGLASPNHYGKGFSFGYIAAIYHWASAETLADPARLIALINVIGFWSAAASCVLLWLLAWVLYGLRAATIAVILFALSPMMLELGTSGHPILPAFALFTAGALCLLVPARGVLLILLWLVGTMLLVAAMTVRAEVGLALPFVILARLGFGSLYGFYRSALRRAVAPMLAIVAFLALKHLYADSSAGSGQLVPFLRQFIRIREIPVGLYVFALSCGIVTTLAGLALGAVTARRFFVARRRTTEPAVFNERRELLYSATAPLVLIAVPLAFFIANPRPGRHFILCLAGLSLLAGSIIARRFAQQPLAAYALAFAIVLGNQTLGTLIGPLILRDAPSKIVALADGTRHLPRGVPTGSSWTYHRDFAAEERRTDAFAAQVARPCDDNTLVVSLNATQIFLDLYGSSHDWDPTERLLGRFPVQRARIGNRTTLVLSENEGWPADAAAEALTDPALRGFKLIRDPNSISIYDRAAIPPERVARLGCAP